MNDDGGDDYAIFLEEDESDGDYDMPSVSWPYGKPTQQPMPLPPPASTPSHSSSRLQRLPPVLIVDRILRYLPDRTTLSRLALTSRHFNQLVFSHDCERLWNHGDVPFAFCIDTYCPSCGLMTRNKRQKSTSCTAQVVLRLLEKCPIRTLKLHCFITDIPHCLRSLAKPQTLQSLDLTLTNKSNSPPLEDLLADVALDLGLGALSLASDSPAPAPAPSPTATQLLRSSSSSSSGSSSGGGGSGSALQKGRSPTCTAATAGKGNSCADDSLPSAPRDGCAHHAPIMEAPSTPLLTVFPALKDLSLDSSHLQHVNPQGRAMLLDLLGRNLESLSFSGLSPPGVFAILSPRCPKLTRLRVDRAASEQDLSTFRSATIEDLELCRSTFTLHAGSLDGFTALKRLRYTPSFRCDSAQMEGVVGAAPRTLESISLEVPSACVNEVLHAISRRLHMARCVAIQGAYETGVLSEAALAALGRQCPFLASLDISSTRSVSDIAVDAASLPVLASFSSLASLRVKYHPATVAALPALLLQSDALRCGGRVALWERRKWAGPDRWRQMEIDVQDVAEQFPTCIIVLEATI